MVGRRRDVETSMPHKPKAGVHLPSPPPPPLPRRPDETTPSIEAFFAMENGRTNLTEALRSVLLFKIDGYSATAAMSSSDYIKSRWSVGGHEWEVQFNPKYDQAFADWVALRFILLGEHQGEGESKLQACTSKPET